MWEWLTWRRREKWRPVHSINKEALIMDWKWHDKHSQSCHGWNAIELVSNQMTFHPQHPTKLLWSSAIRNLCDGKSPTSNCANVSGSSYNSAPICNSGDMYAELKSHALNIGKVPEQFGDCRNGCRCWLESASGLFPRSQVLHRPKMEINTILS